MAQDRPPTTDEIRRAIDNGETGDKVNFPDPAAAPLGTDDEAAGRPPETARKEAALLTERRPLQRRPGEQAEGGRGRAALWAVLVAVLIALVLIAYGVWSR